MTPGAKLFDDDRKAGSRPGGTQTQFGELLSYAGRKKAVSVVPDLGSVRSGPAAEVGAMFRLHLTADDLVRVRLVGSYGPYGEALFGLGALADGRRAGALFGGWRQRMRRT